MKKYLKEYASLLIIAGLIILLDQLTKAWVRQNLSIGEIYLPDLWLTEYARIIHWKNAGAAFGMFQSFGGIFMVLSFVVSGVIIYYYPQIPRQDWIIRLAMCVLLGGAVGNLIDRLTVGHVTDFASIGDFPVFNVADACISIGVVILFIGMWVQEKNKQNAGSEIHDDSTMAQGSESKAIHEEIQGE